MSDALQLQPVMQAIADRLKRAGVVTEAFGYPTTGVGDREATVGYPAEFTYGLPFGRSLDTAVIPVWVIAGVAEDAPTAAYISELTGDGPRSLKAVLEGDLDGLVNALILRRVLLERVRFTDTIERMSVRADCEVTS